MTPYLIIVDMTGWTSSPEWWNKKRSKLW